MTVGPILAPAGMKSLAPSGLTPLSAPRPGTGVQTGTHSTVDFGERISSAFNDLQQAQAKAAGSARAWEMGVENDLAAVMVDQQVASLGFQLTLNVRNKALGAYRDIMNMPL